MVIDAGPALSEGVKFDSGSARKSQLISLDGIRKVICLGPGIVISTLLGSGVCLLFPAWLQTAAVGAWLATAAVLLGSRAESVALRALFRARELDVVSPSRVAAVATDLHRLGVGSPALCLFVSGRVQPGVAFGVGRKSVILSRALISDIESGQVTFDEALAVLVHSALATSSGRTRLDLAIRFWSTPWRILSSAGVPRRGLLGAAWKARPAIVGVAIWQSIEGSFAPSAAGGKLTGVALALILASTYAIPQLPNHWQSHVQSRVDRDVAALGLGSALVSILRRDRQTANAARRIRALEEVLGPDRSCLRVRS